MKMAAHNNIFAPGGVDVWLKVLLSLFRFVSWTGRSFKLPALTQTLALCTMPRDSLVATRIGTFACRAFPCDTKASKRVNFFHARQGNDEPKYYF
jgi:hypothetical protein